MKSISLIVEPDGHTRHLVDPLSERIGGAVGPKVATCRNSHVESWASLSAEAKSSLHKRYAVGPGRMLASIDPNDFWADMTPVGGPVLGPFENHSTAIKHERIWLRDHDMPCPIIRSEEADDTDK